MATVSALSHIQLLLPGRIMELTGPARVGTTTPRKLKIRITEQDNKHTDFWISIPDELDVRSYMNDPDNLWRVRYVAQSSEDVSYLAISDIKVSGKWIEAEPA